MRGDPDWWTPRVQWLFYVLAGLSYVGLGIWQKWMLNWIIGPIWLVAFVTLVPAAIERVRRHR